MLPTPQPHNCGVIFPRELALPRECLGTLPNLQEGGQPPSTIHSPELEPRPGSLMVSAFLLLDGQTLRRPPRGATAFVLGGLLVTECLPSFRGRLADSIVPVGTLLLGNREE